MCKTLRKGQIELGLVISQYKVYFIFYLLLWLFKSKKAPIHGQWPRKSTALISFYLPLLPLRSGHLTSLDLPPYHLSFSLT